MTTSVKFVADGTANNGKIVLLVTYADPGVPIVADINAYWGITDPNGLVIKPFTGPDPYPSTAQDGTITPTPGEEFELMVDIPVGSDGNYVLGEYNFRLYLKDGELGNDEDASYEEEFFYNFDFQTVAKNLTEYGAAVLTSEYNCATGEITATDSTSLEGYTLVERVLRLTPPNVPGNPAPVSFTTGSAALVFAFAWNNAYYQVSLSLVRTYEQVSDDWTFTVSEMLTAQDTIHVVCATNMCEAAACLSEGLSKLEDLGCSLGSWHNIPNSELVPVVRKAMYGVLALLYKQCGNYNLSAQYAAIAGDCDCGCGADSAQDGAITPYVPPT